MGSSTTSVDRLKTLRQLFSLPWAFWLINIVYALDGFAYFGIIIRLTNNFTNDLHISTTYATIMTGVFSAAVSLFMFGFGSYSERFGVRKSLIAAFFVLTLGRVMLCLAPFMGGYAAGAGMAMASLLVMPLAKVLQTANYSGIKHTARTAAPCSPELRTVSSRNHGGLVIPVRAGA
jgi:MFS family permease